MADPPPLAACEDHVRRLRAVGRRHGWLAAAGTAARCAAPAVVVVPFLVLVGQGALAVQVLMVATPAVLAAAAFDRARQARRFSRLLEVLELTGQVPISGALAREVFDVEELVTQGSSEGFLLMLGENVRRTLTAAQQQLDAGLERAEFTSAGFAELFAKRVHAEEGLRSALTAELHDTVAQTLLTAQWELEQGGSLDEALAQVTMAEGQLRAVMAQTRPPELNRDLATSVRELLEEMSTRYKLDLRVTGWPAPGDTVPSASALTVYRFFQEALANVAKHSGASRADLSLTADAAVIATVTDYGKGFVTTAVRPAGGRHVGLLLLNDRARTLGGRVHVKSTPGNGATATLILPGQVGRAHAVRREPAA